MKLFLVGTLVCILAGLLIIVVAIFGLPKALALGAIPLALTGFALQMAASYQNRPNRRLPPRR